VLLFFCRLLSCALERLSIVVSKRARSERAIFQGEIYTLHRLMTNKFVETTFLYYHKLLINESRIITVSIPNSEFNGRIVSFAHKSVLFLVLITEISLRYIKNNLIARFLIPDDPPMPENVRHESNRTAYDDV